MLQTLINEEEREVDTGRIRKESSLLIRCVDIVG